MTFRPPPISDGASARASVVHLLSRAYSLPCSTAVQAFLQLVQPTSRFQLALDVLLPLLDDGPGAPELHLAQRILVSFLLYSLYAPHPISINPFKSVLFVTFRNERERAARAASQGRVYENEQLVWVLWKLLKGDGSDVCTSSSCTMQGLMIHRLVLTPRAHLLARLCHRSSEQLICNLTSHCTTLKIRAYIHFRLVFRC